jgi:hypothetical protein
MTMDPSSGEHAQSDDDSGSAGLGNGLKAKLHEVEDSYAQGEDRPIISYAKVIGFYMGAVGGLSLVAKATRRPVPKLTPYDVALLGMATGKLARLITKDSITSAIRAPFTQYEGVSGPAELHEKVRDGSGLQHSIGELLTCPFCLGQWVATGFVFGHVFAPGVTRVVTSTFTALGIADFFQYAQAKAQQATG